MEISRNPRLLFNLLKEQIQAAEKTESPSPAVHRIEFADQVTLNVKKPIQVTIPSPYTVQGQENLRLEIQAGTIVDNNNETNDSIGLKTGSGAFQVTEQLPHRGYPYIVSKLRQNRWTYHAKGLEA